MLVLSRKEQQQIKIGDNIVITVLKTKGNVVSIGIEAPIEVPVLRGEIAERRRAAAAQETAGIESVAAPAADRVLHARVPRQHRMPSVAQVLAGGRPLADLLASRSVAVG